MCHCCLEAWRYVCEGMEIRSYQASFVRLIFYVSSYQIQKILNFSRLKKCLVGDNPPLSTPLTMGGSRWTLMTPIEVLNTHFSFPDYCIQLTLFDGLTTIDNQDVTLGKIFSWKKNFRLNNLEFLFDTYIVV